MGIQFDAQGKPYTLENGRQAYLAPIDAAQYAKLFVTDPQQRAAVLQDQYSRGTLTPDAVARLTAYAQGHGVTTQNPMGNRPENMNGFWKGYSWDPSTGDYAGHMGAGITGALEGGAALAGPMVVGPMLAGGAGAAAGGGLSADGTLPFSTAPGVHAAALSGAVTPSAAAGGSMATGAAGTAAAGAAPSFASRLSNMVTTPKGIAGLAALIPSLRSVLSGGGSSSGLGNATGIEDEITKALAMQRQRTEQAQPVYDAMVNMAYGMTPTRYRPATAPAGYQPNTPAKDAYQYQAPRFG